MPPAVPGVVATVVPPGSEPSPLRSDVAGFLGRCRRGPVGQPVRIEGWRAFEAVFGGLDEGMYLPWAVRGYFENEGEVAWIERIVPEGSVGLSGVWELDVPGAPDLLAQVAADIAGPAPGADPATLQRSYRVQATSPGDWSVGLRVELSYVKYGRSGLPEVDVVIRSLREPAEAFVGLDARRLVEEVNARSRLIRLSVVDTAILGTSSAHIRG